MKPKFVALDEKLAEYVARHHTNNDDPLLQEMAREAEAMGDISSMRISNDQGTFLSLLVACTNARLAIEIGTFTGSSALCIARGLHRGGKLICCDQSEEWTARARRHWEAAGVGPRIELRLGPAADTINDLDPALMFDFAFVDADKAGYDTYFELLLPKLHTDGLMVFDNMLYSGRVADENEQDPNVRAVHALNEKLSNDIRVESVLLPVADGLMICRKRSQPLSPAFDV